jgi:histone deacetylase 1/2
MWHRRLGHPALQVVQHVLHSHDLPSTIESNKNKVVCDAYQQGKSHQLPYSLYTRVTKYPLEIIYSDVWGPAQTSVSGHYFYVSFVDAYDRFIWLYLLKHKSDVSMICSFSSRNMWNDFLAVKSFMFKLIGVGNMRNFTPSFMV